MRGFSVETISIIFIVGRINAAIVQKYRFDSTVRDGRLPFNDRSLPHARLREELGSDEPYSAHLWLHQQPVAASAAAAAAASTRRSQMARGTVVLDGASLESSL